MEGDEAVIASRSIGRVEEITVHEGDRVKAGAVIARISDDAVNARLSAAQWSLAQAKAHLLTARRQLPVLAQQAHMAGLRMEQASTQYSGNSMGARAATAASNFAVLRAQAQLQAAIQQADVVQNQIKQTVIEQQQSATDSQGRVDEAANRVASSEAALTRAVVNSVQADREAKRYRTLASQEAVTNQEAEQREDRAKSAAAAVDEAQKNVDAARGTLNAEKSSLENPRVKGAQIDTYRSQLRSALAQEQSARASIHEAVANRAQAMGSAITVSADVLNSALQATDRARINDLSTQAKADVKAAEAEVKQTRAKVREALAARNDLTVRSPFDGTVITRSVEPGAVVASGSPLVTLLDLRKVYLRGYVPISAATEISVGEPARIYLDSSPAEALDAVVARIDPEAQFTPENTYFQDDRVRQVIGLKLRLKSPSIGAKPGIPAEAKVLTVGATWPAEPRA